MHRTNPGRDCVSAAADTRLPSPTTLDAIIERAEAARNRYLARLSEPRVRKSTRHMYRRWLNIIEMRLEYLRAHREEWEKPV
jgi:hypothetical protein